MSHHLHRPVAAVTRINVLQGQARVSAGPRVEFTTVLGSCVATCLFDPEEEVGGMNHFLLAEPPASVAPGDFDEHYGVYLMEMLINEMLANGAAKSRLRAHLYGGANLNSGLARIGTRNAEFARSFLARSASPSCARTWAATMPAASISAPRAVRCDAAPPKTTLSAKPAPRSARRSRGAMSNCFDQIATKASRPMNKSTRILTVDDSASMRALLNHALTSQGFNVAQAEDGEVALEWLAMNEVDVVITDINMPRLDGFGLIERLRQGSRHRDRPILVLTTESSEEKKSPRASGRRHGLDRQALDPEKLVAAVRRVAH
jgi:chemotaxis receptor (MCP) glutamine deamidase CheD